MKLKQILILLISLLTGIFIFYIFGGLLFILIFVMLWIDKIIIGKLKTPLEFGIELFSIPAILVGLVHGPIVGFIFATFAIAILGTILDFIATALGSSQLYDTGAAPFFPTVDTFFAGIMAVVAGLLRTSMPFFYIVVVCMSVKVFLNYIKDFMMGVPMKFSKFVNFGLNLLIAYYLQSVFIALI